jgi:hypothetical protein
MKSQVAVYGSHEKALQAIKVLEQADFPLKQVSLVGKAELVYDNVHVKSYEPVKNAPVVIGAIIGPMLGVMTGVGIFTIPGFGLLYGAGAIIGAIAGFDLGLVSGGLITLLVTLGIKKESVVQYEEHLHGGKFLVIVQGSEEEIKQAEHILHTEGTHLQLDTH